MNKATRNIAASVALLGIGLTSALAAQADDLGVAEGYNVFVFGTFSQGSVDSGGAIAVGGNASITGYSLGTGLSAFSSNAFVVGGNLTASGGTVNGNVIVGGNTNFQQPTIDGNLNGNGTVTLGTYGTVDGNVKHGSTYTNPNTTVMGTVSSGTTALPFSFSAAQTTWTNNATYYSGLAQTGTNVGSFGAITLTGTKTGLNVFNVSYSQFSGLNGTGGLTISVPTGATALINIAGGTTANPLNLMNYQITLASGASATNILYNFYQATSITDTNVAILGSILAPKADFQGGGSGGGTLNGTLIASSFDGGNLQANSDGFTGTLPSASTPEPGTYGLAAAGLLSGLMIRKRSRRRRGIAA